MMEGTKKMIPVNFEPEATNQVLIMPYPVWTVLGLVFVVAIIAGLVLWFKSKKSEEPKVEAN